MDLGTILTTAKAIRSTVEQYEDLPVKSQVIELVQQLMEARIAELERIEEMATLKDRIRELEARLAEREALYARHNAFWRRTSNEAAPDEGPFCPKCWQGDGRAVLMNVDDSDECWRCKVCDTSVKRPDHDVIFARKYRPSGGVVRRDLDHFVHW